MTTRIDHVVGEAIARGLVEETYAKQKRVARPWPIVILTAFLTFVASVPLCGLLLLTVLDQKWNIAYVFTSLLVLGAAVSLLRMREVPLFLEYLSVSLLGTGLILLSCPPFDHGSATLAVVATVVLTVGVPQAWIRAVLGASLAFQLAAITATIDGGTFLFGRSYVWLGWHAALAAWLVGHVALHIAERQGRYATAGTIESVLAGACAMMVVMLAYASGRTFLVSELLPGVEWTTPSEWPWESDLYLPSTISSCLGLAAGVFLALRIRRVYWPCLLVVAAAIASIAWVADYLGALLLIIAICLVWHRDQLAVLASAAAMWTIGALYYSLHWPLIYKSALLLGTGALLFGATWLLAPNTTSPPHVRSSPQVPRWSTWGLLVPAAVVVVAVNVGIWQKERVIGQGTTIFVRLAPVDPRSLVQGDYMSLAFDLPLEIRQQTTPSMLAIARRGTDGITDVIRFHDGESALKPDELLIEVSRRGNRNVLVSDAWYFREGDSVRWSRAAFGELRVDGRGKAVLVGLRGPGLEKL